MIRRTLLLVIPVGLLLALFAPLAVPTLGEEDFLKYWSATHLLVTGGNPYNPIELRTLEHSLRPEQVPLDVPVVEAWNPPWLMLLLAPFGLLPFDIAKLAWMFCNVCLTGLALMLTWRWLTAPGEIKGYVLAMMAFFLFGETLVLIQIGQISMLVLLGVLLVSWGLRTKRDVWAGASILLLMLKPHITYLVLLILLIWIIRQRRWRVIAGAAAAFLLSGLVVWVIRPDWIASYLNMLTNLPYMGLYTSTLGSLMSAWLGTEIFRFSAILLLPLIPWLIRLTEKDWLTGLNLSLLLSVPLSPYGFSFDQVVLLPAVVQIILWLWRKHLPGKIAWGIALGLAGVYALDLWAVSLSGLPFYWMVLPPLAILGLYFLAWKQRLTPRDQPLTRRHEKLT